MAEWRGPCLPRLVERAHAHTPPPKLPLSSLTRARRRRAHARTGVGRVLGPGYVPEEYKAGRMGDNSLWRFCQASVCGRGVGNGVGRATVDDAA